MIKCSDSLGVTNRKVYKWFIFRNYMKIQNKRPEYSKTEAERKIGVYEKVSKALIAIGCAGMISAAISVPIFHEYNTPKIVRTYQAAQMLTQELRDRRESLREKLEGASYQTPEINELEKTFNTKYNEILPKINTLIEEGMETEISKIESDSEFKQYQQNKRVGDITFGCLYFGGFLTFLGGIVGNKIAKKKKLGLESKLQAEASSN